MGKNTKNKSGQKAAQSQPSTATARTPEVHVDESSTTPAPLSSSDSTQKNNIESVATTPSVSNTASYVALQLENEDLKAALAHLTSEKDKLTAELQEKDQLILKKDTDLAIIKTFMEEIDSHIELSKEFLSSGATESNHVNAVEDDLPSVHVKRMIDLISVLTNMKAELHAARLKLEEEVAQRQSDVDRLEDEKLSMCNKYKSVLER